MSKEDDYDSDYSDIGSAHSDIGSAHSDEEEFNKDYKKGGYHPVNIGDRFHNGRYIVVRKLGWGHFSTVWLALDTLTDSHVALKIVKSADRYTESAFEEIKLLESIKTTNPNADGYKRVAQLLDNFWHIGPNGKHTCMTFEVLGESLLSLMKRYRYKGIPQHIVKRIAKQILEGLDYLHRECGIVHTDLKPENVLVWIPDIEDYLKTDTAQILQEIKEKEKKEEGQETKAETDIAPLLNSTSSQSLLGDIHTEGMSKSKKKRLKKKLKKKGLVEAKEKIEEEGSNNLENGMSTLNVSEGSNLANKEVKVIPSCTLDIANIRSEKDDKVFDNITVKIADLGNACWMNGEYTHIIQTRQYRSPEVIIGAKWTNKADMWSFACMIFELLTGEFLFDPRKGSGYNKDDDHLAQMLELMLTVPKSLVNSGSLSQDFFTSAGKLKHIKKLRNRRLRDVLHDTFLIAPEDADATSTFLLPMLEMGMDKRASAEEALSHSWLKDA